ncbi:MAG: hypothetical protein SVP26_02630 [Chloroflexota bacterium]|nr:hypothetical protein [Chloroflexota bacterium]
MSSDRLPIGLPTFLMLSILPRMMERDMLGRMYIRLGRVLTLSAWLYETGAVLGRCWRDRLPMVVEMFEVESKREEFTLFWSKEAKRRLKMYGRQPRSFPIFVVETDLQMFTGKKLKDLPKIADKKLHHKQGQRWLELAERAMIEGIMFGSMFPDLTRAMLVNQYQKNAKDSWKQARRYGITLSQEPPQTTVADKEKECIAMAHDYVVEYHPGLIHGLGLA